MTGEQATPRELQALCDRMSIQDAKPLINHWLRCGANMMVAREEGKQIAHGTDERRRADDAA